MNKIPSSRTDVTRIAERIETMIWKEKYKIGVPLIDAQHEELFARVTSFVETLRSDKDWNEKVNNVNKTLEFMKAYVVTHFKDEEAYQEKIGYPAFSAHKQTHDDMVAYVGMISEQYEKEGYREITMQQFAGKLVTWLVNHVVAEDQKIGDYEKGKEGK